MVFKNIFKNNNNYLSPIKSHRPHRRFPFHRAVASHKPLVVGPEQKQTRNTKGYPQNGIAVETRVHDEDRLKNVRLVGFIFSDKGLNVFFSQDLHLATF